MVSLSTTIVSYYDSVHLVYIPHFTELPSYVTNTHTLFDLSQSVHH